ncbi:MAG: bifunctional DNA-formamidopyrimidine glycosylase/DNA-(apurinic or apyrimidinic site) lyase [Deltaproteobacteria bacterium]|nr:bifunctional DNA-formamidopyrimidine glycosylase/DNA-(apurinic or apyrimidinic site) lyase [Deltaproteobacteria bacterium]
MMPELPEVEILVRHLEPLLVDRAVRTVRVSRPKILAPTPVGEFTDALVGARFESVCRRGKYLLFTLRRPAGRGRLLLLGHLGMTGRMYVRPPAPPPKHAAVVLDLGAEELLFEDTRYFGRLTLDTRPVAKLGPEPLGRAFSTRQFREALARSAQPVKVKLLDQGLVAGIGNIYASEALFRAGISPRLPARNLRSEQVAALRRSIREVLSEAITRGSTVPPDHLGTRRNGAVSEGAEAAYGDSSAEWLRVYERAGRPCLRCRAPIERLVQAGRSTYYCPVCQEA